MNKRNFIKTSLGAIIAAPFAYLLKSSKEPIGRISVDLIQNRGWNCGDFLAWNNETGKAVCAQDFGFDSSYDFAPQMVDQRLGICVGYMEKNRKFIRVNSKTAQYAFRGNFSIKYIGKDEQIKALFC